MSYFEIFETVVLFLVLTFKIVTLFLLFKAAKNLNATITDNARPAQLSPTVKERTLQNENSILRR